VRPKSGDLRWTDRRRCVWLAVRPQRVHPRRNTIAVTGWVQEGRFREFLSAVCAAVGTSLDEYTWQHVWDLVNRTDSDSRYAGSCLRSSGAVVVLAGTGEARCEFRFEAIATWVLLRVEVPPLASAAVEAAMLAGQRCKAEPGGTPHTGPL